jgi:hypothetical protein
MNDGRGERRRWFIAQKLALNMHGFWRTGYAARMVLSTATHFPITAFFLPKALAK